MEQLFSRMNNIVKHAVIRAQVGKLWGQNVGLNNFWRSKLCHRRSYAKVFFPLLKGGSSSSTRHSDNGLQMRRERTAQEQTEQKSLRVCALFVEEKARKESHDGRYHCFRTQ